MPWINWLLLVSVLTLVFAFRSSTALAFAFGMAVTGTITITTYADDGITHVTARFGYMETPDVTAALAQLDAAATEGRLQLDQASYFLSRIELQVGDRPTMATWRKRVFIAADAGDSFNLPRDRTVIMGSHIEV